MARLSWDEYFLNLVFDIGERGTCNRGRSGAIIVRDNRILTTGYVGSPQGLPHCDDVGHLIHTVIDEKGEESKHCCRTIHAEENAILQAAQFGTSLMGGTIYCKIFPCFRCAMKIIRVGIIRVVALYHYQREDYSAKLFKEANIEYNIINDLSINYLEGEKNE